MNKQIKFLLVCLLVFALNNTFAQNALPKAPEILFSSCLNNKELKNGFYKNKFLILDFWATWCGPCIASFPHLDSLSKKFSSDSVVFAIISSEEKNKVAQFLKDRNIKAFHLLDSISDESRSKTKVNDLHGKTAQNFGVVGIPHTVVIDKNNNLVWEGSSSSLTSNQLSKILQGKGKETYEANLTVRNKLISESQINKKTVSDAKKDTLHIGEATLITALMPDRLSQMMAGKDMKRNISYVQIEGRPMNAYYNYFTETPLNRINNAVEGNFFLRYEHNINLSWTEFKKIGIDLLAQALNIKYIKTVKLVDVYRIEIVNNNRFDLQSKPLNEGSNHSSSDQNSNELIYLNFKLKEIAKDLEDFFNVPIVIVNEDLKNKLCDITIKKGNINEVNAFLIEKYGIELKKGKENIEFVDIVRI